MLEVQDGDEVTVVYAEAQTADGQPRVHEFPTTWYARTRPPDWRQVGLVDTDEAPATVRAAREGAPAGSTVRLYDPSVGADPVLTGQADAAGRFLLTGAGDLPPTVQLTAQEPGLPESPRMDLPRSRVTGRVVLPGTDVGLLSALVELRPDGAPDPCAGRREDGSCAAGPGLTNNDGWLFQQGGPGQGGFTGDAGAYDLYVDQQGVPDEARWGAAAYGNSGPFRVVLPDGQQTVDAGLLPLEPPVFEGFVRDGLGRPVVGAMFEARRPDGAFVLGTNDASRAGGGFALHLPDGDYRVPVRGPYACTGYGFAELDLTVRDGVATPSTATVVLEILGIEGGVLSVPTAPSAVGTTVRLDGPGVEVTLPPVDEPGAVSLGCVSTGMGDRELLRPPVSVEWDRPVDDATVCLDYDQAHVDAAGVAEQDLELLRLEEDGTATSIATDHDLEGDRLCGQTTALSTFGVAVPSGSQDEHARVTARPADDSCPPERVPEDGMTDVPEGDAHEPSIDCVLWWGVARGRSSTEYVPGRHVTRAQMATFLANLLERSGGALPVPTRDWFSDDDGTDHERSINRLAEAGVVRGRTADSYGPELAVERDAMATFLVRAYEWRTGQSLPATRDWFADDEGNAHEPSIDRAAEAGFTGGAAQGGYAPRVAVTRGQMASFLARVLDLLVERGHATAPEQDVS